MVDLGENPRVVIDHDDGVAVGHEVAHDAQKAIDVGRVQADGGLVEHIEHTGGLVAHGARELDALALAGRERGARAVKTQVAQAQIHETGSGSPERIADGRRHGPHRGRQRPRHLGDPAHKLGERHRVRVGKPDARHARDAGRFRKARAAAVLARPLYQEARDALQALLVLSLGERVFHRVDGVEVGEVQLGEVVALL